MTPLQIFLGVFVVGFTISLLLQPKLILTLLENEKDKKYNKEMKCKNTGLLTRIIHALFGGIFFVIVAWGADKLLVNDAVLRTRTLERIPPAGLRV